MSIFSTGEMAAQINSLDWTATPLGPIVSWPGTLLHSVNLILDSNLPMVIFWGEEKIQIFNDAYAQLAAADDRQKYSSCLGRPCTSDWENIPQGLALLLDELRETGRPRSLRDDTWSLNFTVLRSSDGETGGVFLVFTDQTIAAVHRSMEQRLAAMAAQLPIGIAILTGGDLVLEMANKYMLNLWGRDLTVIGKPLLEVLPEVNGQAFIVHLHKVYLTGIPFYKFDAPVEFVKDGQLQVVYMDYSFTLLIENSGPPTHLIVLAEDVTERTLSRRREQHLTDEINLINEELTNNNDQLHVAIDDLAITQYQLEYNLEQLEISEARFQNLIQDAPMGIIVLTGEESWIEIVNDAYGRLIGRTADFLYHRKLFDIIPEAEKDFKRTIDKVRETGKPVYLYESEYVVFVEGHQRRGYLNLVYQPFRDADGTICGTLIVCQDVTEQVLARKELEAMEKNKDDFLSIASHELKTPLTSIKAYHQIIERMDDVTKIRVLLKKSAANVQRLEKLISDLLDVTKINAGKLTYNLQQIHIGDLIDNCVENFQQAYDTHKIRIEDRADVFIIGDHFRLEQVINNILSNAIKYSPEGKEVIVKSSVEEDAVVVSIQDFGIGIPAEKINLLFDRYYRAADDPHRFEGLGLGLYIAAEILKHHQGTFWVESRIGYGTTFFFRLDKLPK